MMNFYQQNREVPCGHGILSAAKNLRPTTDSSLRSECHGQDHSDDRF